MLSWFFEDRNAVDTGTNELTSSIISIEGIPKPNQGVQAHGALDRQTTFTRGFTRETTFTFAFAETLGLNFDDDQAWTNRLITEYIKVEDNSREGDVPLPAAFAQERRFWKVMLIVGVIGCVMGLAGSGFMNTADYVPKLWVDNNDFSEVQDGYYYAGELYWIPIPMVGGFVVGMIRWYFEYPDNLPGLFKEINSHHVEPKWSPLTFIISAVSLASGASLGPEQALGNLGGGLGTYITEHVDMAEDDKHLVVLSGMSAALGALFPTPILGVMMIHELGCPPKTYMESILVLSFGSCIAFVIYYALLDPTTYVDPFSASYYVSFSHVIIYFLNSLMILVITFIFNPSKFYEMKAYPQLEV